MKLITEKVEKTVTPFDITLRIESVQEARLLWHVFNKMFLRTAIYEDNYSTSNFSSNVAEHFTGDDITTKNFIESKLKEMGERI